MNFEADLQAIFPLGFSRMQSLATAGQSNGGSAATGTHSPRNRSIRGAGLRKPRGSGGISAPSSRSVSSDERAGGTGPQQVKQMVRSRGSQQQGWDVPMASVEVDTEGPSSPALSSVPIVSTFARGAVGALVNTTSKDGHVKGSSRKRSSHGNDANDEQNDTAAKRKKIGHAELSLSAERAGGSDQQQSHAESVPMQPVVHQPEATASSHDEGHLAKAQTNDADRSRSVNDNNKTVIEYQKTRGIRHILMATPTRKYQEYECKYSDSQHISSQTVV